MSPARTRSFVRSYKMHDMDIPESVAGIARAGAGTNNIPVDRMSERGVPVFNAPGANANAVKELAIASLLLGARNICAAEEYVKGLTEEGDALNKAVEAGKKQYVGFELPGRTLGIIGLGAIGVRVANAALDLGMKVDRLRPADHCPSRLGALGWRSSRPIRSISFFSTRTRSVATCRLSTRPAASSTGIAWRC